MSGSSYHSSFEIGWVAESSVATVVSMWKSLDLTVLLGVLKIVTNSNEESSMLASRDDMVTITVD